MRLLTVRPAGREATVAVAVVDFGAVVTVPLVPLVTLAPVTVKVKLVVLGTVGMVREPLMSELWPLLLVLPEMVTVSPAVIPWAAVVVTVKVFTVLFPLPEEETLTLLMVK